uniref:BESS domain-containing protein n=1 Tax=Myripristis murdjan TaxID=586833 RepID=A0A667ZQ55_9TELE
RLILSVFNFPELYNVTLPNYRCTESRTNAWRNISALECKRKWKNLRDRYLKEVRMEIKSKQQGEMIPSRWKYRQLLNFLAPFTGSRNGTTENGNNEEDHENPDNESGNTEGETTAAEDALSLPCSQTTLIPAKRQAKDSSLPNRPRDEDELFLLSFVPALKRLAPQKRCETKIRIQQIMYEAEFNVSQPEDCD